MIRSEFQGLHCGGDTSVASEHDYRDCGVDALDGLNQIETTHTRHLQIDQNKVRTDARGKPQSFVLCAGFVRLATTISKCPAQPISKYLVVIDHNDYRIYVSHSFSATFHESGRVFF